MIEQNVLYGKEARQKVQTGVNKAADAVKVTLGSAGRNVIFSRLVQTQNGMQFFPARFTKDGVTVLRNFMLPDPIEDIGAGIVREASKKTADVVGDGTTTSAVLVQALVNEGLKLIDEGANAMELKKGIDIAVDFVVAKLKKMAIPVGEDFEKIKNIATVSANHDTELGDLIGNIYKEIGKDGIITVENSKGLDTFIKKLDGFKIPQGYISPFLVNNMGKGTSELNNPYILLFEKPIQHMQTLIPILEKVVQQNAPLVIFCEDLEGEAFQTIVGNVKNGKIKCCVIKNPYLGERLIEAMEDIALLTGGTYISSQNGIKLESVQLNHLGKASKFIATKESTTIIGGNGDRGKVNKRIEELREKLKETKEEKEIDYIERRIAKLAGGVAVLYVGAATESEAEEKKDRCDDAIRATKAAIEEGYVPGGGTAFLKLKPELLNLNTDQVKGFNLLIEVLKEPVNQIAKNAGITLNGEIKQIQDSTFEIGYNAKTQKVENLIKSGVIDPVKVLRCSLQNAASAAGMILTTECLYIC